MSKYLWSCACRFQRVKPAPNALNRGWEEGVAVGMGTDNVETILDKDCKPVPAPIWNYTLTPSEGCFLMPLVET